MWQGAYGQGAPGLDWFYGASECSRVSGVLTTDAPCVGCCGEGNKHAILTQPSRIKQPECLT